MKSEQTQSEALERAQSGGSFRNDAIVRNEFLRRGIKASPRQDVFTYAAWLAQGRQVRRGEHGVKLLTWIPIPAKNAEAGRARIRPRSVSVFHRSQTDPR